MKKLLLLLLLLMLPIMGQNCEPTTPPQGGNAYCAGDNYSIMDGVPYGWEQDGVAGAYSAILNGIPSDERRSTVQVRFGQSYCTGVVLANKVILTAGHCGWGATTAHTIMVLEPNVIPPGGVAPIQNMQFASSKTGQLTTRGAKDAFAFDAAALGGNDTGLTLAFLAVVSRHVVHPDYLRYVNSGNRDQEARKADLMLLFMNEDLPGPYVGYGFYEPGLALVCHGLVAQGFGRWEGTGLSLREGRYIITKQTDKALISRRESDKTKICFGDSGGPLYADVAGIPRLAGITTTTMSSDCLVGGTHVNVAYPPFHTWIRNTVASGG